MSQNVNAEIIAIGTEILLGEITDTNSVFMARALRDIGINLFFMTSVGDNEARIADAIGIALSRADVVLTCGGLGPTIDDMTRQGVARATGRGLTFHQHLLDQIAARFAGFKVTMTDNNRRQAYTPDDAVIIENPVGTAPAFIVELGDKCVISLPGVPREMKFLMSERVIPYLREKYQLGGAIIKARVLKTAGIGESTLDELIGRDLLEASNPTVGLAAHSGVIDVRITAKAETEADADAMIAATEAQLRDRIGEHLFGADSDTIESALVSMLRARGQTVAIGEIGIEPFISMRVQVVDVTGEVVRSLQQFDSLDAFERVYGVPTAQPTRQIAEQAAQKLSEHSGATTALAVVSRSAQADDHADSEEVSAIAVYAPAGVRSRGYGLGGGSETMHLWTATWGMATLWRMVKDQE